MAEACVCGGSTAAPNPDCERCRLVADLAEAREAARYAVVCLRGAAAGRWGKWTRQDVQALARDIVNRWPWTEPGAAEAGE